MVKFLAVAVLGRLCSIILSMIVQQSKKKVLYFSLYLLAYLQEDMAYCEVFLCR